MIKGSYLIYSLMAIFILFFFFVPIFEDRGLVFDLEIIMAGLGVAIDAYIGGDQFAAYHKTKQLEKGKKFDANRKKLSHMIVVLFLMTAQMMILQLIYTTVQYPLEFMIGTLTLGITLYSTGEKIKSGVEDQTPK